jgi:hypothetical protein
MMVREQVRTWPSGRLGDPALVVCGYGYPQHALRERLRWEMRTERGPYELDNDTRIVTTNVTL